MKKLLLFILSLFMCLSLVACKGNTDTPDVPDVPGDTDDSDKPNYPSTDDPETTENVGFIIHFNFKFIFQV